jgi:hypothetical protein
MPSVCAQRAVKPTTDRSKDPLPGSGTSDTEFIVPEKAGPQAQKNEASVHCPGKLGKGLGSVVEVFNTPFA